MSLYPDPKTAIIQALASNNGIALNPDEYVMGIPAVYNDPNGVYNTAVTVSAKNSISAFQGQVTVQYNRLDLGKLASQLPATLYAPNLLTTSDLITWLNNNYGLNFVPGDLVPGVLGLVGGSGQCTITAQSGSLGWVGSATLHIQLGGEDVSSAARNAALGGLLYPDRDETKSFGEIATYWRDYSFYSNLLSTVNANAVSAADLGHIAQALTLSTKSVEEWSSTAPARYSVLAATVLYNGLTVGQPIANSADYTHVMIIQLDVNNCFAYSGELFMHYNIQQ